MRAPRQQSDARVAQLVQVRDRRADAERVSRGEVEGRNLRSCAVNRHEGDASVGDILVGGEIGEEVSVSAGDENEPVHMVFNK